MSRDVYRLGSHCYLWYKPVISIFRIFFPKVIESSFWCKFIFFAKCARAYDSWKQCQWIVRTLTCKHKIWGKNWSYLRSYLKAFPVFNVLEACRVYLLTIDLRIVKFTKKIYRAVFWKMRNLYSWTKLSAKTVTKAAECKLIKFSLLAIAQSNSPLFLYTVFNGIKPLWDEAAFPKLIIFLKN